MTRGCTYTDCAYLLLISSCRISGAVGYVLLVAIILAVFIGIDLIQMLSIDHVFVNERHQSLYVCGGGTLIKCHPTCGCMLKLSKLGLCLTKR